MASDLASAATRRRNGDYSAASNGWYQHGLDADMLADAYAAELDDTPLTPELLVSMGYADKGRYSTWLTNGLVDAIPRTDHFSVSVCGTGCHARCKTLGDLRTAIRLSGIEVKHEG